MAYYTIIVQLRYQENLLSITDPLSDQVWICFLICIPVYIVAIVFMNYFYSGNTNWEAAASSVIRSALSERKSTNFEPPKYLHQKLLIIMWSWMMLILISGYKANLLAMITRPTLDIPFTNAHDMVKQTQIKWALAEGGLFSGYAKSLDHGSTVRKIYDQAITKYDINQIVMEDFGNNALICDISQCEKIIANYFSKTGACNYFMTEDKILASDSAFAFQVI